MNPASFTARIRPMEHSDLDRVLAIARSLPAAPHWPLAAYQQAIQPHATPRRLCLVAEEVASGQLAAFAVALLLPPESELEIIAVSLQAQRRGLGRQIFCALAGELGRSGCQQIILEVRATNLPALALYRSLGFCQTGRRASYYADPVEDALLMNLPLEPPPALSQL
jgi:ribosomal-protein-alanine N-acetyltransferase